MKRATLLTLLLTSSAKAEEVVSFEGYAFSGADIVIVGELHTHPDHHLTQAAVIAQVAPTAVIFEMLTAEQAARVTSETITNANLGALLDWEATGWPDFAIYAPIFASLGDATVVGAAPTAAQTALARADGAAAAINDPAFGLTEDLPQAEQAQREAEMQASHCNALPEDMLPWFVDQQRFADASFVKATLDALSQFGPPVVVITGNGHARTDWGMPHYIKRVAPEVTTISLGQITEPTANAPFDAWVVTSPPPPEEDPCAAFN